MVVHETASAAQAFALMTAGMVTAVGVIDGAGSLIGNLSATDLKGLTRDAFHYLLVPVLTFLSSTYVAATATSAIPVPRPRSNPVTVTPVASLGFVLETMTRENLHRVWVVDSDTTRRPVGIVSMTDLIRAFTANGVA